ncbi:Disintegrin and metalloproteinase domain-containing protein 25 [Plecturocebus cupreus]
MCREKKNKCIISWCFNRNSHNCPEQDPLMGSGHCYEKGCINYKQNKLIPEVTILVTVVSEAGYVRYNIPDILCGRVQCENVKEILHLRDNSTVH